MFFYSSVCVLHLWHISYQQLPAHTPLLNSVVLLFFAGCVWLCLTVYYIFCCFPFVSLQSYDFMYYAALCCMLLYFILVYSYSFFLRLPYAISVPKILLPSMMKLWKIKEFFFIRPPSKYWINSIFGSLLRKMLRNLKMFLAVRYQRHKNKSVYPNSRLSPVQM